VHLPISAVDAINPAFEHAKAQLLKPFRFGQWVRLAFVGFLAGEMGSGGGCNSSWRMPVTHHPRGGGQIHTLFAGTPISQLWHHPAMTAGMITLLIVAGLALLVVFVYISSVMRFILFDSIIAKECRIRKGWAGRKLEGMRLFVWHIWLMVVSIGGCIALIGVPVACAWGLGWFEHPRDHLLGLVFGGCLLLMLFVALVVILALIHVMTKDFVVPQMALEQIGAVEGWRRLWMWMKAEKGGYGGYIGMKIVLAIGAGIVLGIVTVIVVVITLIPIGGVGAIAVIGAMAAGLKWSFFTIALAVVAGIVLFGIIMFAASFISVPAIVFFPAYSIYFFAPRYPPLAGLLWPPGAPSVTPPVTPPLEPPALPPTPAPLS
jgi:hypothetical protein